MIRLAVILVALLSGTAAGWLALQATWREPLASEPEVIEEPKLDVLTPDVDLRRGAKLSAEHLDWTPWPERQVSAGMILRQERPGAIADLTGRILRSNLYSGEPIREQHLSKSDGGFLATVLQPGMRAIGVSVEVEMTAGGFVLPNDRVDVLHTVVRDIDGDGISTGATRTILTNVRVLAIGKSTFSDDALVADEGAEQERSGETMTGDTATLEVTTDQAEALMSARASGELSLALRASDDFGLSEIGDLTMIERDRRPDAAPAADPDGDSARTHEVRVISAGVAEIVVTSAKGED